MGVGLSFDKRTALRFGRFFVDVAVAVGAFYLSYFIVTASRGIDWIPARMISEKYAASKRVNVMSADANAPTAIGWLAPMSQAPI